MSFRGDDRGDTRESRDRSTSGSPVGRRPAGRGRSASPLEMFGEELTEEEKQQYQELLDHFGGDEEKLKEAIEQFMEEYSTDPDKFERMMQEEEAAEMQRQSRGQSRTPSPAARR